MYEDFFGFEHHPFDVTPDPEFIYYSEQHKEALAHMLYGVQERRGFVLITGRVGSGKTTLSRAFLGELDDDTETAVILNSQLPAHDLLLSIAEKFGVSLPTSAGRTQVIDSLEKFAREKYEQGKNLCLVIDESQNLSPEALEQLRLLSNIETNKDKLIQTILIGQPELENLLNRSELRQLKQRIAVRSYLTNLSREETREYIIHRLSLASGGGTPAVELSHPIHERLFDVTGGNPRAINLIGDRMLVAAFQEETRQLRERHLDKAIEDLSGSRDQRNPEDDLVLHRVFQTNSTNGAKDASVVTGLSRFVNYFMPELPLSRYSSNPLSIVLITSIITLFFGLTLLGWSDGSISLFTPSSAGKNPLTSSSEQKLKETLTSATKDELSIKESKSDYNSPSSQPELNEDSRDQGIQNKNPVNQSNNNRLRDEETGLGDWNNPLEVRPVSDGSHLRDGLKSKLGGHALARYISVYLSRLNPGSENSSYPDDLSGGVVKNSLGSIIPGILDAQLVSVDQPLNQIKRYRLPSFLLIKTESVKRYVLFDPESGNIWDPIKGAVYSEDRYVSKNWLGNSVVLAQSEFDLDKSLRRGSRGEAVTKLQKKLNQAGNFGIPEIGIFGPKTKRSVDLFQQDVGIRSDGVADPITKLMLLRETKHKITWSIQEIQSFTEKVDIHVID